MGAADSGGQLILFSTPARSAEHQAQVARRRRRARADRRGTTRMITRVESLAEQAEREERACRLHGDMLGARAAHDRAVGARRAAQILRAGPGGVSALIDGSHPEAA